MIVMKNMTYFEIASENEDVLVRYFIPHSISNEKYDIFLDWDLSPLVHFYMTLLEVEVQSP